MILNVEQQDIDKAREALSKPRAIRCQVCPIAQALMRICPTQLEEDTWLVDPWSIHIGNVHYPLPLEATEFIRVFDVKNVASPISFEVLNLNC